MGTMASAWVGLLVDQKFEVLGAATRATEIANCLAKVEVGSDEVGGLIADLNARERELRAVRANSKAEDMADILQRAADDLRARASVGAESAPTLEGPSAAFLQGHTPTPEFVVGPGKTDTEPQGWASKND